MKIEAHTIRFGNPEWLQRCAPTLDAWCKKHSIPLKIWDESVAKEKGYPDVKFCQVDMLRQFLEGDSEQMIYIDADIYVHPDTPAPEFGPGMHIRPHGRRVNNPFWLPWCQEHFGRDPIDGGCYRNAGVWVINRTSAQKLMSVIKEPYIAGIMEQNHWNWWIMEAEHRRGLTVHDLPPEWNAFPMETAPAWFFHLYGINKMQRLGFFERKGLIPRSVPRGRPAQSPPKSWMKRNVVIQNREKRLAAPQKPAGPVWPMFMDQVHLDMLKGLLEAHRPKKAMEIGSHKGVSTQVFLDALDAGWIGELVVVEPMPTPELLDRIKACSKPEKVRLVKESSWEILEPVDFVLIDGDHRWPAYADLAQALALKVPVIAMHDIASFSAGIESCHGSEGAWEILKACKDRNAVDDKEKRDGMWTERGFGYSILSTKDRACKNPEKTPS